MLKDYYFDAKYPGENFVTVTKAECVQCLDTMYEVIDFVHTVRQQLGLDCEKIEKKLLNDSNNVSKLKVF